MTQTRTQQSGLFDLSGHAALVTGGNGGIGLGMAAGLVDAGADVAIWGRNEAKNKAAAEELRSRTRTRVVAIQCDVSDQSAVERAFTSTIEALGTLDSCFANAGIFPNRAGFLDVTPEEWRRVMAVDLEGVFFTFQAAVRSMLERGDGGSIVATSSIASIYGQPLSEHYGAAKAGVEAMVRGLAVELGGAGVRANAVLPGWVVVDNTRAAYEDQNFVAKVQRRVPLRRWGAPEDLAGIAVFLASPASAYITGQSFVVDGGYAVF